MKRLLTGALLLVVCLPVGQAADSDADKAKEGLKALQDFIGGWKGSGAPEKPRPTSSELWSETINWGWNFKGDVFLTLEFDKGKYFKKGQLRYLPKTQKYELSVTDAKDKKLVFTGEYKDDYLTLDYEDPATKETQRLSMNLAGDGVRFIYRLSRKKENSTVFVKDYMVAATKIGESLGAKEKKNECVVSGGLGTMTVSFKGETFYVCCSGCRDEFNATPEKYVKEFKAKKGIK